MIAVARICQFYKGIAYFLQGDDAAIQVFDMFKRKLLDLPT